MKSNYQNQKINSCIGRLFCVIRLVCISIVFICLTGSLLNAQPVNMNVSPKINSDNTITFTLQAPNAKSVILKGHGMISSLKDIKKGEEIKGLQMTKDKNDSWSITIGPLPNDLYMYNYQVDGITILDPMNRAIYDGSDELSNIVSLTAKDGTNFWQTKNVPHGTVHQHTYYSRRANSNLEFFVYTPADYETGKNNYPVLYLLHGRSEKANSWISGGAVNAIADNFISDGKMAPTVIVLPYCRIQSSGELTAADKKNIASLFYSNFEKELFECIIPLVEKNYRVYKDKDHNAIAGFSLGGTLADKAGLHHLEKFSYIGIMSSGLYDFEQEHNDLLNKPEDSNKQIKYLLLASGSNDIYGPGGSSIDGLKIVDKLLTRNGIKHTFFELQNAGHNWNAWRYYLAEKFLPNLWK